MDDKSKASASGAAASASKDEKNKEELKAEATEKGPSATSSAKNADENSRTKETSEASSSKETASNATATESKRSRDDEDASEESAKKKSKKDDTNAAATTASSSGSVKPSRGTRGSLSDKGEKTTKGGKRTANADKRSSPTSSATNSPKKPASRDQSDEEEDNKQKGATESSAVGGTEPKVPPLKIVLSGGSNSVSDDKKSPTGSAKDDAKEVDKPASASESSAALAATAASTSAAEMSSENTNQSVASGEGMDDNDSKSASNSERGTLGTRLTRSRANQGTPGPSDQGNDSPREHPANVNAQCENANLEPPSLKETPASASSMTMASGSGSNMASHNSQSSNNMNYAEYHVKKRKLRSQVEDSSANNGAAQTSSNSSFTSAAGDTKGKNSNGAALSNGNEPLNDIEKYLNIRKQVEQRRKNLFPVQPKPPQGFKDYLMNRKTYLLQDNHHLRSVPKLQPPHSLEGPLKELFREQEEERYKLRLKHVVEKEKLVLAVEQEILRVHGRAARALANQSLPYSVCTILRDEEIYTPIDPQQEEKNRDIRSRYNGRLFLSWLQDVDDKWEKIKEQMVLRHHNEAESLNAVQKMDWEWKVNEITGGNGGVGVPLMDDLRIPMVHVSDDFDMSECETESSLFRANQRVAGHN